MILSWDFTNTDIDGEKLIITKKFKLEKINYYCPSCGCQKWCYNLPSDVIDDYSDGNTICTKCEATFLIIPTWDTPKEWEQKTEVLNG